MMIERRLGKCGLVWVLLFFLQGFRGSCDAAPQDSHAMGVTSQVRQIWKDVNVGTDASYRNLVESARQERAIAPADVRHVCTALAENRIEWAPPTGFEIFFAHGSVVLKWQTEISLRLDATAAMTRFAAEMDHLKYEVANAKTVVSANKALGTLSPLPMYTVLTTDARGEVDVKAFQRTDNRTTICVLSVAKPYIGLSGLRCVLRAEWYVVRNCGDNSPNLGDVLDALPEQFVAAHLGAQFFKELRPRKISEYVSTRNNDIRIRFDDALSRVLVKSLEGAGFAYDRELESRGKRITLMWSRFSDSTYAYIDTLPGSESTVFRCQAPQHVGPPRTEKPLPVHPSLRLPRSKRPVVTLADVKFEARKLRQDAEYLEELANRTSNSDWTETGYRDNRYSNEPWYQARWETSHVPGTSYSRKSLPHRSVTIEWKGAWKYGEGDTISCVRGRGRWVPLVGWSAHVDYVSRTEAFRGNDSFSVKAGLREYENDSTAGNAFLLLRPNLSETVDDQGLSYTCKAALPWNPSDEFAAQQKQQFLKLFESPEVMRELVISRLEQLRGISLEQIQDNKLTAMDHSSVRSNVPPTAIPVERNPPSEEVRGKLTEAVNHRIDERLMLLRRDFREIFVAMKKALPLEVEKLR